MTSIAKYTNLLLLHIAACALSYTRLIAAAPPDGLHRRDATPSSVGIDIMYPNSETEWWVGQWHNITWDPCSLPEGLDDGTLGTFYLLNNETNMDPVPLVNTTEWSTDRVQLVDPIPSDVADSAAYRIGLVLGDNPSITGKGCDVDVSCGEPFSISNGTEASAGADPEDDCID